MLKTLPLLLSLISIPSSFINYSSNIYRNPDNSLKGLGTIIVQLKQKPPTLRERGFLFQYLGCDRLSTDLLECNFVVTNEQERRKLRIYSRLSRIIDENGNELKGSVATLGGTESRSRYVMNELSTNIPMKGSITFRGAIGNKIQLFDISTSTNGANGTNIFNGFNVEFKQK